MLRYAVLIVAGCNQVYGLDPTHLPDAAPQFAVTGQLMQRWVENDPAAQRGWLGALRDPRIGRAFSLIHRVPARPWTVASLARELAM